MCCSLYTFGSVAVDWSLCIQPPSQLISHPGQWYCLMLSRGTVWAHTELMSCRGDVFINWTIDLHYTSVNCMIMQAWVIFFRVDFYLTTEIQSERQAVKRRCCIQKKENQVYIICMCIYMYIYNLPWTLSKYKYNVVWTALMYFNTLNSKLEWHQKSDWIRLIHTSPFLWQPKSIFQSLSAKKFFFFFFN